MLSVVELEKTGHILIVRENGKKDSNLKELVRWSNDEQIDLE